MVQASELFPHSNIYVSVECDICHRIFERRMSDYNKNIKRNGKYICKSCTTKINNERRMPDMPQKQIDQFYSFCDAHGYTPMSSIDDYKNNRTKLFYECPRHGVQSINIVGIMRGRMCSECTSERVAASFALSQDEVRSIVEEKNNDVLLNAEEYKNIKTNNLRIICGSCHKEFTTSLASIKASNGMCPKCGVIKCTDAGRLSQAEVEKRINSVGGNKLLNPNDYISIGVENLKIRCGECGSVFVTSLGNYIYNEKIRCGNCSKRISKMERHVMKFLNDNHISYEYNYKFEDCKDKKCLPFDFYLPDENLIIETDGGQHFDPVWGEESFRNTLLHDNMKNNYCRWNDIKLLRIPYWDDDKIDDILSDELNLVQDRNKK